VAPLCRGSHDGTVGARERCRARDDARGLGSDRQCYLGTMLNAGSPTYGPSKAALEALSAIMAKDLDGTGVTVNVLVPGGITNTPMVSDAAGFDRAQMIQPEVMAPPLVWLVSDAAEKVTGRRFLAVHWDTRLPPEQAAEKAGAPVAWTSIATMPITPNRS